ncbi:MAG: response regulator [Candidatus Omnitrophota bacterium]
MQKTILVADDDPVLVRILQRAIEDAGYRVVTARDGEDALKKIESECIDLVLLDIQMPKMHGYSFIFKMRKIEGRHDIPVIVLTANQQMKDLFVAEGVREYIVKPCSSQELLLKIKQHINS